MEGLLGLSWDLQLVLVAGYLGYKTAMVGKGVSDRTEDFLLKVLTFGLLARLGAEIVSWVTPNLLPKEAVDVLVLLQAKWLAVIAIAVLAAVIWRKWGSYQISKLASDTDVYHDDHESSAWLSLSNAKAKWNHVEVHIEGDNILQSSVRDLPTGLPTKPFILNDDGMLLYVTSLIGQDNKAVKDDHFNEDGYSRVTFIPKDQIRRIDVGWKPR